MSGAPGPSVPPGPATPAAPAPEVSVVVPHYRAPRDLDRLVAALVAQDHPASRLQLVIADDGSPEPPVLPAGLPFAAAVVRQEDRGFRAAAARALGARAAEGTVLAFLDGDMLPEPGYVRAAAARPGASADAVTVGRRRHVAADLVAAGWRPGDPVPPGALLAEPAWLRDAYAQTADLARADSTGYRYVISAVLTVAREVYADAGGFDPAFVGYGGEDWELAHRLWRVGADVRHEPAAVAWQAGDDFAGRTDPAEARRVKAREALVLASRIPATTARGRGLSLTGPARLAVRLTPGPGDTDPAALLLGVDAALQAFPHARVHVPGPLDDDARAALADPRVTLGAGPDQTVGPGAAVDRPAVLPSPADPGALPAPDDPGGLPAPGDLAGVRAVPDWTARVSVPLRPSAPGGRPDPAAADAWLRALERAGVERVEVLGEPSPQGAEREAVAVLTCSRAAWRARRGSVAGRTLRVDAARLGWAPVGEAPDLEAWFGGWG